MHACVLDIKEIIDLALFPCSLVQGQNEIQKSKLSDIHGCTLSCELWAETVLAFLSPVSQQMLYPSFLS